MYCTVYVTLISYETFASRRDAYKSMCTQMLWEMHVQYSITVTLSFSSCVGVMNPMPCCHHPASPPL